MFERERERVVYTHIYFCNIDNTGIHVSVRVHSVLHHCDYYILVLTWKYHFSIDLIIILIIIVKSLKYEFYITKQ